MRLDGFRAPLLDRLAAPLTTFCSTVTQRGGFADDLFLPSAVRGGKGNQRHLRVRLVRPGYRVSHLAFWRLPISILLASCRQRAPCAIILPTLFENAKAMVIDFSVRTVLRQFELVLEGRSIYVNAHYLAELSPYFEKVCFGVGFREASEHRVLIDDETFDDMVAFLAFICPTEEHTYQREVTAENFAVLAHFCHRMQFPSVFRQLQDYLETDLLDKSCINEGALVEMAVEVLVDGLFDASVIHRICRRLAYFGIDRVKELTKSLPSEYGTAINEEVERAMPQTLVQQRRSSYHWNGAFSQRMFF